MFTPRDYQVEGHKNTMDYLASKNGNKPGLVIYPTGTGKSLSIAMVAEDYPEKAVILCPSQEILSQNYKKYLSFGGEASIYSASFGSKEMGEVTFATLGSVKKLGKQFKDHGVSLLIIDESHLATNPEGGMFKTFLESLSPKHTLGFTATPFRLKSYSDMSGFSYSQLNMMNRVRPKFFSNIVHVTQIPFAVERGYWAPVELHEEVFNPLGLVLNSTGAEYTESSISMAVASNNINNRIYSQIKRLINTDTKSIIAFLDKVDSCYTMVAALRRKGIKAEVIEANTKDKVRKQVIEDFKNGLINVVCCVSTLTTGFDFPELQTVIMGRPTNSLAVFYQIYGRLVRPFEGKIGQFYDYGGNISKFGRMEDMTIEDYNGHGWSIFSGDNLLTGVPMGGEPITRAHLDKMKAKAFKPGKKSVFEFGMWKGVELSKVPLTYINWALDNAKHNMTKTLIEACIEKKMTTV